MLTYVDFLIDISSVDNRDPEKEEASLARVQALTSAWKSRTHEPEDLGLRDQKALDSSAASDAGSRPNVERQQTATTELERYTSAVQSEDLRRAGFFRQTAVLTARAHKSVYRNYVLLIGFLTQAVVLGLVIGFNFFQLPDTPTGIQSLKNLTFQLSVFPTVRS